jgi:urea transport system ATP-binding protein
MSNKKHDKLEDMLKTIDLVEQRDHAASSLSHGQKQWLEIGMLLVQEPKLLLLDEPVAGMTRRERTRTGELVQEISKTTSVLLVEHDMEFVRQFSNTVTVLHMGNVLCEGSMDEVTANDEVIEVYLGRAKSHKEAVAV